MQLGTEVGLGPDHIVLGGDPAPPPQNGAEPPPQFSVHVCSGQTAGWIKMAIGMARPHCATYGTSSLPQKTGRAPSFSAHLCCGKTAGCIKMPLGMEVGFSPCDFVLDGDPAALLKNGVEPPNFQPMSIVAKRLDG